LRVQAKTPRTSSPARSVAIAGAVDGPVSGSAATGTMMERRPDGATVMLMQPLIWESRPDGLRAPALVCAFTGWNDAGDAASAALRYFGASLGATRFAQIDPEDFFDFQATRPRVELVDGLTREIQWPSVEIYEARVPRAPRDLVLLSGPEPSFRWRTFTRLIVDLAEALGTQMVVTMGALLADVPHSRPVGITGLSSDMGLVERLGLSPTSYEGPTGIVGVLHAACQDAGLPSASLWASVPHYVAAAPNPKAALALVRKLEGLVGVAVDATALETAAADYDTQVNRAVQSDPEIQAFVERLEQAATEAEESGEGLGQLPSGDTLAREFQRFLKQRGND
jgi:proteasome assembly chaperone (PAC2) family protein